MTRPGLDFDGLFDLSADRIGVVLKALGASFAPGSTPERGRASCPVHGGRDFNLSYSNGRACCHSICGGRGWDAVGLVREIEQLEFAPAVERLAEILVQPLPSQAAIKTGAENSRARSSLRDERCTNVPPQNVPALWSQMAHRDDEGEEYLRSRSLLLDHLPEDVIRFNRGGTTSAFLDIAAEKGFRIVFAIRGPDGAIRSLSLRHVGDGADWNGELRTKLVLKGTSTSGVAIVRPEIGLLLQGDPEFGADEVVVCEGGTDWLAATLGNDLAAIERQAPPAWILGCIGAANAEGVIDAFAPILRNRVVRIWLDADEAGIQAAVAASRAARRAGARSIRRLLPRHKDVAADLAEEATC